MTCSFRSGWMAASLLAGLTWFGLAGAWAADPTTQPTAEGVDAVPREQTIYIPYDKLREVFEKEGRGVFLPYEEFQRLWQAARAAEQRPPEAEPPVGAVLTETANTATVTGDVVRVAARLRIELLAAGWHKIPLRLRDAAIARATLGGQPARLLTDEDGQYYLLLEKEGDEAEEVELTLEYAKAFTKTPGRNSVSFEAPRAPVSRWEVHVPEAGVKVNIEPLLAATEVPGAEGGEESEETVILAFVGAAPAVQIAWTPRAEGASGLQALVTAQTTQRVWIGEGVTRTRAELVYDISRAPIGQLVVRVPAGHKIVNVFDSNVRRWSVSEGDEGQDITAELFEAAQGTQSLLVELEHFRDEGTERLEEEYTIGPIVARDATRQRGLVLVGVADGLRVEALQRTGLLQVDAGELGALQSEAPGGVWALSYRYATLPFELAVQVDKILPRITVDTRVEVLLDPQFEQVEMRAVYDIEKVGVFRLELEIPAEYDVRGVQPYAADGVTPVTIADHYRAADDPTRLVVNLARKALGRVGLGVSLHRWVREPALVDTVGQVVELPVAVPRVAPDAVERQTGRLIVYPTQSLRASPSASSGLRPIPLAEALAGMQSSFPRVLEDADEQAGAMSFAFADAAATLTVKAERRKPYITVRQLLAVRVESGVVRYEAALHYDVRYSAVPTVRLDLPAELAPLVRVLTTGIRETVLDAAEPAPAEGYVAWELRRETSFKGQFMIALGWERKTSPLDIGQSATVAVPHLKPMGTDRAWGQIALTKAESIDLRAVGEGEDTPPRGLRPIDPRHDLLTGGEDLRSDGVARAFEFHEDWMLNVVATRYQLEEVKRTSIERALLRMVVTRSKTVSTQAVYRLRSAQQRLAFTLPEKAEFDTNPARIDGRPVALERGQGDTFFVPLIGHDQDTPLLLELRYTAPAADLHLVCPDFPSDPAVQKTWLMAYLPTEWVYLGARGPWTEALFWLWNESTGFESRPEMPAEHLVSWVSEGLEGVESAGDTFQTDGRPFLFSTLRPAGGAAGALVLATVHETVLRVVIIVVVLLIGLLLLRWRATRRLLVLGMLVILLILGAVFLPTLVRQVMDGTFASAVAIVGVVWLVRYLAWTRPQQRAARAWHAARAAELSGPPSEPPAPPPTASETAETESGEGQGGASDA